MKTSPLPQLIGQLQWVFPLRRFVHRGASSLLKRRSRIGPGWLGIFAGVILLFLLGASTLPATAQTPSPPVDLDWTSDETDFTTRMAWGDFDNDGDLDLFVGNGMVYIEDIPFLGNIGFPNRHNRLYCNEKGVLKSCWVSEESKFTLGVAWGDADGDGDLDLAVGNGTFRICVTTFFGPICVGEGEQSYIYRNDTDPMDGEPKFIKAWSSPQRDYTVDVAWGDYDGDGDLDLAAANGTYEIDARTRDISGSLPRANQIYINEGKDANGNFDFVLDDTFLPPADVSFGIDWIDVNNDEHLDLAVANYGHDYVYCNRGKRDGSAKPVLEECWKSEEDDFTISMDWGDYDGDNKPDLVVGNGNLFSAERSHIYRNWGMKDDGQLDLRWVESFKPMAAGTISVAWGDMDADGDLDLAVGNGNFSANQTNYIYCNQDGVIDDQPCWSAPVADITTNVTWGDVDNDGDQDLAIGNISVPVGQNNRLYRNDHLPLSNTFGFTGTLAQRTCTRSVAWGDVDRDGDLDLALGNDIDPRFDSAACQGINQLYLNDNGQMTLTTTPGLTETENTHSVAWGDMDGDGDLDLAVGNSGGAPSRLYCNKSNISAQNIEFEMALAFAEDENVSSVAWGDMDGDGDLDLATGNGGLTDWSMPVAESNHLYRNDGITAECRLKLTEVWTSTEKAATFSVAWGDVDNDGDLDLAVGNSVSSNQLYRNDGLQDDDSPAFSLAWTAVYTDDTHSVAWGDMDGDGDLDLAVGNTTQSKRVFCNEDGRLARTDCWRSIEAERTRSVAWGDVDNDGDLDLAVGNQEAPNQIYLNQDKLLSKSAVWASNDINDRDMRSSWTLSVAWGDVDNDGDLDLAAGNAESYYTGIYTNTLFDHVNRAAPATVQLTRPGVNADFYSVPKIWSGATIPITYTLSHPESHPVKFVRALYSLNGGGDWLPAVATTDTITTNLATSPIGVSHVYIWHVSESDFFGQSDNVVFRIEAIPAIMTKTNAIPGPYLYGSYAAQTYPFRVRGNQVRVRNELGQPLSNVSVYKLSKGQHTGGCAIGSGTDGCTPEDTSPFVTDANGYLLGRGQIDIGDQLIALAPMALPLTHTTRYSGTMELYYTNDVISSTATMTPVIAHTVQNRGVQTLTVSSDNPLILFNLDVSLEWDARNDAAYREQLKSDLLRTSELLYDWTNGQVALGKIKVYYDRQHWNDADIRILASNRLRPNSDQGGVIVTPITETVTVTNSRILTYTPGQVRMAATWNRFGDASSGNLGEDWSRALAHELGHYLFFLYDNYLGFDTQGFFVPVSGCPGVMSNPYSDRDDDGYDEFHPYDGHPSTNCENALSHRIAVRTDWETMQHFYAMLHAPTPDNPHTINRGPNTLPLVVTDIEFIDHDPNTPSDALVAPLITLIDEAGARYLPTNQARAFLFKADHLIDLGSPVRDEVMARGASSGDDLCVYDLANQRLGCYKIEDSELPLQLSTVNNWEPDVIITPITTNTIQITVTVSHLPITASLKAQVFPVTVISNSQPITTTLCGPAAVVRCEPARTTYTNTFSITEVMVEAYVRIWVDEVVPRREIVTDYTTGGDPICKRRRCPKIANSGRKNRGAAPILSGDGQTAIYGINFDRSVEQFYTLQTATFVPDPPPWATVIGQAYRLIGTAGAPSLAGAYLSISYLENEVPPGEENTITLYRYTGGVEPWTPLTTTLQPDFDNAVAAIDVPGLYAAMSSIAIPLKGPGWNLISYPVQETRPVTEALQSIDGFYTTVYGYDATAPDDPWRVYDVNLPPSANNLKELEFGQGYWIRMTRDETLLLKGSAPSTVEALSLAQSRALQLESQLVLGNVPNPPALYYGPVVTTAEFTPTAEMTVIAYIDGNQCGIGATRPVGDQIMYSVKVPAADMGDLVGCGAPGRKVRFEIDAQPMAAIVDWDNARPQQQSLAPQ